MDTPTNCLFITSVEKEGPFLKVWGQIDKNTSLYVEQVLHSFTNQFDNGLCIPHPESLQVGILCCAKYKDNKYYRAKITSLDFLHNRYVEVNFIDYGHRDLVPITNIRSLEGFETSFISIPAQASSFLVAEAVCPRGEWNDAFLEEICKEIRYTEVNFTVIAQVTKHYLVKLYVGVNDLAIILISKGLMRHTSLSTQEAVLLSMMPRSTLPQQPTHQQNIATYKAFTLEPGHQYEVYVSYVTDGPCNFSVQLKQSEEVLAKLMKEINSMTLTPIEGIPIPGTVCLARCMEDAHICRAVVTNEVDGQYKVFYVDFGNFEVVPLESLYEIPFKFVIPKVMAIRFALAGIEKSTVTLEMQCAFKQFVDNRLIHMKVMPMTTRTSLPRCELWDPESQISAFDIVNQAASAGYPEHISLNRGFSQPVKVSYVFSCNKFYVQLKSRQDDLIKLMLDIQIICRDLEPVTKVRKGMPCYALYEGDQQWYRSQIVEIITAEQVKVQYVDFGNEELVFIPFLKPIEGRQLTILRPQAIECCLNGYQNMEPDQERDNLLEELILEQEFTMKVVEMQGKKALIELIDSANYNVASLLLDKIAITKSQVSPMLVQGGNKIEHRKSSQPCISKETRKPDPNRNSQESNESNEANSWRQNNKGFNKNYDRNKRDNDLNDSTDSERHSNKSFGKNDRNRNDFNSRNTEGGSWKQNNRGFNKNQDRYNRDNNRNDWNGGDERESPKGKDQKQNDWSNDHKGNEKSDWKSHEKSDWKRNEKPDWKSHEKSDWKSNEKSDWKSHEKSDWKENKKTDWKGNDKSDWKGSEKSDWKGSEKSDWKSHEKSDWKGNEKSDWKSHEKSDWKTHEKSDWKDNKKSDWKGNDKSDWKGNEKSDWKENKKSDWKGNENSEWKSHEKSDWKSDDKSDWGNSSQENESQNFKRKEFGRDTGRKSFQPRNKDDDTRQYNKRDNWSNKENDRRTFRSKNDWEGSENKNENDGWGGKEGRRGRDNFKPNRNRNEDGGGDWNNSESSQRGGGFKKRQDFKRDTSELSSSGSENSFRKGFNKGKPAFNKNFDKPRNFVDDSGKDSWKNSSSTTSEVPNPAPSTAKFTRLNVDNTEANITISWFHNPVSFYIQLESTQDDFKQLMVDIQEAYKSRTPSTAVVGAPIIGLFPEDNVLYRAEVLEVIGSQFKIYYVDFGNVSVIDKVWPIEMRFMELPAQALCCKLNGIEPPAETWPDATSYSSYFDKKQFLCKFIATENDITAVQLEYDNEDIGSLLVRDGLAINTLVIAPPELPLLIGQQFRAMLVSVNSLAEFTMCLQTGAILNCSVFNVGESTETWESNLSEKINQILIVYVDDLKDDRLEVTLYDQNGAKIKLINNDEGAYENVELLCPYLIMYSYLSGEITHIEQENVYIQPSATSSTVEYLLNSCYEYYENTTLENPVSPVENYVYAIKGSDGNWYRGRVTKIEDNQITVNYFDYGNSEQVDVNALRELASEHLEIQILCVPVTIKGATEDLICTFVNVTLTFTENGLEGTIQEETPVEAQLAPLEAETPAPIESLNIDTSIEPENVAASPIYCGNLVILSHTDSPSDFYLQLGDSLNAVEQLQATLQEQIPEMNDMENPVIGVLCAAPYSLDQQWYRAQVLDGDSDITTVRFVDYGNTDVLDNHTTRVKTLSPNLLSLEVHATRCRLKLKPVDEEWSTTAIERFQELCNVENLTAQFLSQDEKTNYVELFSNGANIREILIQENLALADEVVTESSSVGFVSHLNSPSEFWIQLENCVEELEWVAEQLSGAENFPEMEDLAPGALCAALFPDDQMWYRARILSNTVAGIEVLFVDYGNSCTSCSLRELPEDLVMLPPLAQKCSLQKPENLSNWGPEMVRKFREISADGQTTFNVKKLSTGETAAVELLLDGADVTTLLLPETVDVRVKSFQGLDEIVLIKDEQELETKFKLEILPDVKWNEESVEKFEEINDSGNTVFQAEFVSEDTIRLYLGLNDIRLDLNGVKISTPTSSPMKIRSEISDGDIKHSDDITGEEELESIADTINENTNSLQNYTNLTEQNATNNELVISVLTGIIDHSTNVVEGRTIVNEIVDDVVIESTVRNDSSDEEIVESEHLETDSQFAEIVSESTVFDEIESNGNQQDTDSIFIETSLESTIPEVEAESGSEDAEQQKNSNEVRGEKNKESEETPTTSDTDNINVNKKEETEESEETSLFDADNLNTEVITESQKTLTTSDTDNIISEETKDETKGVEETSTTTDTDNQKEEMKQLEEIFPISDTVDINTKNTEEKIKDSDKMSTKESDKTPTKENISTKEPEKNPNESGHHLSSEGPLKEAKETDKTAHTKEQEKSATEMSNLDAGKVTINEVEEEAK